MLNVAILGAGIGREHLAAYQTLGADFNVRYIVDQDLNRAQEIAGEISCVDRVETALLDPDIDIVDICLPPHLHVDIAKAALQAGKHVVCEKPLAASPAEVDIVKQVSRDTNKRVFPVFQYRWGPSHAKLRALIKTGLTGNPQVGSIETHWSRDGEYYSVPWRGTWAGENGGALLSHAIHNHDLLTHFMGPVKSVQARVATRVNDIETEDCAAISFELENGALATSSVTLGAAGDRSRLRLVYENLTATSGDAPYAPGMDDWVFEARFPADQSAIDAVLQKTPAEPVGFAGFFASIARALNGGDDETVTLEDGANSISLIAAMYQSARTGQVQTLPLAQDHPLYQGWHP